MLTVRPEFSRPSHAIRALANDVVDDARARVIDEQRPSLPQPPEEIWESERGGRRWSKGTANVRAVDWDSPLLDVRRQSPCE